MISKTDHLIKIIKIILFFILNVISSDTNTTWYVDKPINILMWASLDLSPFSDMVPEKMQKCLYKNCFITRNKFYFSDETYFDVLLFNVIELFLNTTLPQKRLERQKYIFVSREPPALYTPPPKLNGYFNLTWTYKSNSDIPLRYIIVKDRKGNIIGPSKNIKWMDINDMKPISKKIKRKLQSKYLPVAWLVSHCYTPNKREIFVQALQDELIKYQLKVDIFGGCSEKSCADDEELCHAMIETNYYFYLAFENSLCEEYVTEKLLTATKHLTVPIVFGGADYSRYLPQGAYLDSRVLGPPQLASVIYDSIQNKTKYHDFFKWHRYYSLHNPGETPETDDICALCKFLNFDRNTHRTSIYDNITEFWSSLYCD